MSLTDPSIAIQRAVFSALKADDAVMGYVGDSGGAARIYDRVPRKKNGDPDTAFPYISFGELQIIPELAEATDATTDSFTIHTWSRAVGSVEAKELNGAIAAALHDAELSGIQSILLQASRVLPDPDGLTSHGILIFDILTDTSV